MRSQFLASIAGDYSATTVEYASNFPINLRSRLIKDIPDLVNINFQRIFVPNYTRFAQILTTSPFANLCIQSGKQEPMPWTALPSSSNFVSVTDALCFFDIFPAQDLRNAIRLLSILDEYVISFAASHFP